jgi:hypothetical protein
MQARRRRARSSWRRRTAARIIAEPVPSDVRRCCDLLFSESLLSSEGRVLTEALLARAQLSDELGNEAVALSLCESAFKVSQATGDADGMRRSEALSQKLTERHRTAQSIASRAAQLLFTDPSAAEAICTDALRQFRTDVGILALRCACRAQQHVSSGSMDAAKGTVRDATAVVGMDPSNVECAWHGARALLSLGRPRAAGALLDAAARHCRTDQMEQQLSSLRAQVRAAITKGGDPVLIRLERSKKRLREREALRPRGCDPKTTYSPPATVRAVSPLAARLAAYSLTDAALADFEADGFTQLQLPLSPSHAAELTLEASRMFGFGQCHLATTGSVGERRTGARSDQIVFLSAAEAVKSLPALAAVIDVLSCLAAELNARSTSSDGGTLLVPDVCQFASYGPGGRYKPHRDVYLESNGERINDRSVTLIHYLNDGWAAEDGAELRLHPDATEADDEKLLRKWEGGHAGGGKAGRYVDVVPQAGRIIVFRSGLLHEVLPNLNSERRRCAVTLWACNVA